MNTEQTKPESQQNKELNEILADYASRVAYICKHGNMQELANTHGEAIAAIEVLIDRARIEEVTRTPFPVAMSLQADYQNKRIAELQANLKSKGSE